MKLLTRDAFDARFAELTEMRETAQAEFRRANFAAETGSGTEADIQKAKGNLELVDGRIQGLHSARAESERLHAAEVRKTRKAAHKKLTDDTESLLSQREAAIARIEGMARELGSEIALYESLTTQLRSAVTAYRGHYIHSAAATHLAKTRMTSVMEAVTRQTSLPVLVDATIRDDKLTLDGKTLSGLETRYSRDVRFHVGQVEPEGDMA